VCAFLSCSNHLLLQFTILFFLCFLAPSEAVRICQTDTVHVVPWTLP
jgi:hypothetical protein